ncbi:hypothetical protein F2P56_021073 [Juglans regia]|uniref:Uncharacterized protein At4g26450 isoform X1 n=2 Tax=Juglans regia TaxID=51240 RepID=A0A2I4F388_JUGRE|nr:uncharacterized protein At4g26450 isoform X1 [Juglans regia]XP_035549824.1 uncharacterized protein At4g26450 isoform X1 [Juglans regia]KAF5461262.1 hypothetical protein F2P56_021073 [Juglans regia]
MHPRHRSPGNGYRSSSMGMGVAASQISPEGLMVRGHGGFYGGSEFRNFGRGFGRGQGHPKSYQQSPQPPLRKGDIFMEAGRLAAEYLVSQGLLPQSALSPVKWQNGSLKRQLGEFQELRPQEGDQFSLPPEGRTSALARLSNSTSDAGLGSKRRLLGDINPKGRRRAASFRNYSSDYGRDYRRSGSWSDRLRSSADVEGDDNIASGQYHEEEKQFGKNVTDDLHIGGRSELAPKTEDAGDLEFELDEYQFQDDDMLIKASSSSTGKDLQHEANGEFPARPYDFKNMNVGIGEVKHGTSSDETDKQGTKQEVTIQDSVVDGNFSDNTSTDLLTLCKFSKVPTRTRSSLSHRGSKVDPVPKIEEGKAPDMRPQRGSECLVDNAPVDPSLVDAPSSKIYDSRCIESEVARAQFVCSAENVVKVDSADDIEQGEFATQSFSDMQNRQEPPVLPGFPSCGSTVKERCEKRALEDGDIREGIKKARERTPSQVTKADEYLHLSNSSEKKESSQEDRASPGENMIMALDHESLENDSLFTKARTEPCVGYAEEKQLFPGSFKICDLNLGGASETNENHDNDPIHIYHSVSRNRKEPAPIDVDLSMSNTKISGEYSRHVTDAKEIEVIDLENDSALEDKAFHDAARKTETVYMGLEGFPNNASNANDISVIQDGYGLMISELLAGDFSNCSSVPGDVTSMQSGMGLPNGEGSLADDDSIYMSLEEIPLSFLPAWEQQQPRDYEKPF